MFQIIFGGRIRTSGPTNVSQTRNMGTATYVQALAGIQGFQLTTYDGSQNVLVGPCLEDVLSSNAAASASGVVSGEQGSILLDNAIVVTDQVASGVAQSFAVGNPVYANNAGLYTNASGLGTAFVGWSTQNSGSNGQIQFLYMAPRWGN